MYLNINIDYYKNVENIKIFTYLTNHDFIIINKLFNYKNYTYIYIKYMYVNYKYFEILTLALSRCSYNF